MAFSPLLTADYSLRDLCPCNPAIPATYTTPAIPAGPCLPTTSTISYIRNFWRKISAIEFSPSGNFIYFVGGGFVESTNSNLTYLGQIPLSGIDNSRSVNLQCQSVPGFSLSTGIGNQATDQDAEIIQNIESAENGNLYFTKSHSDTLFVLPSPNDPLPIRLNPHNVDLGTTTKPNILLSGNCTNSIPDQIDGYHEYLSGTLFTLTGPSGQVQSGSPITITSSESVSWTSNPSATLNYSPPQSQSCSFVATTPGHYTILGTNSSGCCNNISIDVVESIPTPEPSCNIENFRINLVSTGSNGFTLALDAGPVIIQEVDLSMVDYHVEYSNPACQPANMGIFGNIFSSTTNIGNLNLINNNSHILSWLPGSPGILHQGIRLTISRPSILNLSCCQGKLFFCLKVRIKDINCIVCEKMICREMALNDNYIECPDINPHAVPTNSTR